ncbi:hypothetical protein TrST_g14193 [Triparma strigata]|uniref:Tr-type G domain-containing protein n=1 Tax=Triparma strigata TaxID=1606541 RepID=A0A9W7F0E2_9STRA|nr:hypothetical protein TrST_g14193 [Triparma strigata]
MNFLMIVNGGNTHNATRRMIHSTPAALQPNDNSAPSGGTKNSGTPKKKPNSPSPSPTSNNNNNKKPNKWWRSPSSSSNSNPNSNPPKQNPTNKNNSPKKEQSSWSPPPASQPSRPSSNPPSPPLPPIKIYTSPISIFDLSSTLQLKAHLITSIVSDLGVDTKSIKDKVLDADTQELVCLELGRRTERVGKSKEASRKYINDMKKKEQKDKTDLDARSLSHKTLLSTLPSEVDLALSPTQESSRRLSLDGLQVRPPVVSVMGHVDHGKTTLLDYLRKIAREGEGSKGKKKKSKKKKAKTSNKSSTSSDVAGTEAGGITQVITAFSVPLPPTFLSPTLSKTVTFLDTPGHSSFKSMRTNSGSSTDITVLVISSDDGVNQQTKEVISICKSQDITIVVAITKIDKNGIDVEEAKRRIENELAEEEVYTEEMGGEVMVFPVSGITGEGVPELMEGLVLQAEILELKSLASDPGEALVLDSRVDKGLGIVVDVIVRWGHFKVGDAIVAGVHSGKVKIIKNPNATQQLKNAGPSEPIKLVGLRGLPRAGESLIVVSSESVGKSIAEKRTAAEEARKIKTSVRADPAKMTLELTGGAARTKTRIEAANIAMLAGEKLGREFKRRFIPEIKQRDRFELDRVETPRAPIIVKADCDGTLEAVIESIKALGSETKVDITLDIIHTGVGAVNLHDVNLAKESGGVVFAFGVKVNDREVVNVQEEHEVTVRKHDVIYSLLDDAKKVLGRYAPSIPEERVVGKMKVAEVFNLSGSAKQRKGVEQVAGCKVDEGHVWLQKEGKTNLETFFRVKRDGEVVVEDRGMTLRKFKDRVFDIKAGEECGLSLQNYNNFLKDDVIECVVVDENFLEL